MASPRKLDELAADYVAGTLSADDADEFARLVVEYPELRLEVNRLEKVMGVVLHELPMVEPPPGLKASILTAVDAPPVQMVPQRSPLVWVLAALAAGATLVSLALGLNNHQLRLAKQELEQNLAATAFAQDVQLILHQPDTRFYDFKGTQAAANAFGNMIVDTEGLRAAIAFQDLPPLTTDQTYALWVRYQGQYIPCGTIQPGPGGTVFATLPMPPVYQSRPWVKDVIVTVESADLPAQPTGPIVAETI